MSSVIDFITNTLPSAILPFTVATSFILFKLIAKRSVERTVVIEGSESVVNEKPSVNEAIKLLIEREDVALRVLEEIFQASRDHRMFFFSTSDDSRRAISLRRIQDILRNTMADAIQSNDFATIRDRTLKLIDDAQKEIDALQQRKPFDGLQEPEKSLLIDLLTEIPDTKPIPKQKVFQLADIIKVKHQDMLNLQQENAKSSAWTRWGTYGTIFFGVLSIVLSIYTTLK